MAKKIEMEKSEKGVRIGKASIQRTDAPEYIQSKELMEIFPFTIYGATKGRFGERVQIRFQVAYKTDAGGENETLHKRVLTLDENQERIELMVAVKQHKALTGCRLIKENRGRMGYLRIIDADDVGEYELFEENGNVPSRSISDDDIPF